MSAEYMPYSSSIFAYLSSICNYIEQYLYVYWQYLCHIAAVSLLYVSSICAV